MRKNRLFSKEGQIFSSSPVDRCVVVWTPLKRAQDGGLLWGSQKSVWLKSFHYMGQNDGKWILYSTESDTLNQHKDF